MEQVYGSGGYYCQALTTACKENNLQDKTTTKKIKHKATARATAHYYYVLRKHNLPSKLILATLVYRLSPAFRVTALKSTVTASFEGVVRTLCKS